MSFSARFLSLVCYTLLGVPVLGDGEAEPPSTGCWTWTGQLRTDIPGCAEPPWWHDGSVLGSENVSSPSPSPIQLDGTFDLWNWTYYDEQERDNISLQYSPATQTVYWQKNGAYSSQSPSLSTGPPLSPTLNLSSSQSLSSSPSVSASHNASPGPSTHWPSASASPVPSPDSRITRGADGGTVSSSMFVMATIELFMSQPAVLFETEDEQTMIIDAVAAVLQSVSGIQNISFWNVTEAPQQQTGAAPATSVTVQSIDGPSRKLAQVKQLSCTVTVNIEMVGSATAAVEVALGQAIQDGSLLTNLHKAGLDDVTAIGSYSNYVTTTVPQITSGADAPEAILQPSPSPAEAGLTVSKPNNTGPLLSLGAIIGIAVAGSVSLAMAALLIGFLVVRRRRLASPSPCPPTELLYRPSPTSSPRLDLEGGLPVVVMPYHMYKCPVAPEDVSDTTERLRKALNRWKSPLRTSSGGYSQQDGMTDSIANELPEITVEQECTAPSAPVPGAASPGRHSGASTRIIVNITSESNGLQASVHDNLDSVTE